MDHNKFDRAFSSSFLYLLCNNQELYARIGNYLHPDLFSSEPEKKILEACRDIYKDTGKGPATDVIVYQRLQRWVNQGKLRLDVLAEANNIIDEGLLKSPEVESILREAIPTIQSYHRHKAVLALIDAHGRREDLLAECRALSRINEIGTYITSAGSSFDDVKELMAAMRSLERFPTGINGFDDRLNGGFPRKSVTLWMGSTGEGKSYALCHQAAVGVVLGLNVAYATVELPEPYIWSRTMAAMTGYAVDDFINGVPDAYAALDVVRSKVGGCFRVLQFKANACTTSDIKAFVDNVEEATGRKVDMLMIDPIDRVSIPGLIGHSKALSSSYSLAETVMNSVQDDLTQTYNLYTHLSSQAQRKKSRSATGSFKGTDDVADSMHKSRIADNVVTLNSAIDKVTNSRVMEIYCAKHRSGHGEFSVGPEPVMFDKGMIFPSDILTRFHVQESLSDRYMSW